MTAATRPRAVVVGSGLAGLSCALELARRGWDVTVLSPARAGRDGATHRVHALAPWILLTAPWVRGDSPSRYADDLERRAEGMARPGLAGVLAENAHRTAKELLEILGLERLDEGAVLLSGDTWPRGLRCRPASPAPLVLPLLRSCLAAGVRVEERTLALRVLRAGDRACGLRVLRRKGAMFEVLGADAVVLACGGVGAVFPATTSPRWCRGSAVALAAAAGALLHRPSLTQALPVTATPPGYFPTTAAILRGRILIGGDVLRPQSTLEEATVAMARATADGRRIELDVGFGADDVVPPRLRSSAAVQRKGRVTLTLAVHHSVGGVAIDDHGRCSLPGLYACGEAAGGVQGRTRTMGTGLLEARIFGLRAATAVAGDFRRLGPATPPVVSHPLEAPADPAALERLLDEIMAPLAVLRPVSSVAAALERLSAWPWHEGAMPGEVAALAALRHRAALEIMRAERDAGAVALAADAR